MKVRLSRTARDEIASIALAYRKDSHAAAQGLLARGDSAVEQLKLVPKSGAPRDNLAKGLRVIALRPFVHLLFYTTRNDEVTVTRVLDGRRDLKTMIHDD